MKWSVFGDDIRVEGDTVEVAIFRPGVYHGGASVITEGDINELMESYDAGVHEAPSVIGHAQDRQPGDPAYGWVESLFKRDGLLWARLNKVPDEFKEWVDQGLWKKRSIEVWNDFQNTGKKYLRAIAWLGADVPEVRGLPDVVWAEEEGEFEAIEFEAGLKPRAYRLFQELKQWFAEDEEDDPAEGDGPIEKTMIREDALQQFERIRWIASDELWRLIYDEELSNEEKRTQVEALFQELVQLIQENGDDLLNAFAERSDAMDGTIAMTPEQLQETVKTAVDGALVEFKEQTQTDIDQKVKDGLAQVSAATRRTAVDAYCEKLRGQGFAPALLDDIGLTEFMESLDFQETQVFAEGSKEQTSLMWFEEFVKKLFAAAKGNTLIVPLTEVGGHTPPATSDDGTAVDAEAAVKAAAEYAENSEFYQTLGLTEADLAKVADRVL